MATDPRLIDLTPKEPEQFNLQAVLDAGGDLEGFDPQQLKRWLIRNFDFTREVLTELKAITDPLVANTLPSLNPILGGFTTPDEHGAAGDGSTDDTTAVDTALNTGKKVLLPAGKSYAITGITINEDECIYGLGGKLVTHSTIGTGDSFITLDGSRARLENAIIEITHDCARAIRVRPSTFNTNIYDVSVIGNILSSTQSVEFFVGEFNGISGRSYRCLILNNRWDWESDTHTTLSFIRGMQESIFKANIIKCSDSPTHVWRFFDSKDIQFVNNQVYVDLATVNNVTCVRFEPSGSNKFIICCDNFFESSRGITLINDNNFVVDGNIFNGQTGVCIDAFGSDNIIISNNIMRMASGSTYISNFAASATKLDVDNIKN